MGGIIRSPDRDQQGDQLDDVLDEACRKTDWKLIVDVSRKLLGKGIGLTIEQWNLYRQAIQRQEKGDIHTLFSMSEPDFEFTEKRLEILIAVGDFDYAEGLLAKLPAPMKNLFETKYKEDFEQRKEKHLLQSIAYGKKSVDELPPNLDLSSTCLFSYEKKLISQKMLFLKSKKEFGSQINRLLSSMFQSQVLTERVLEYWEKGFFRRKWAGFLDFLKENERKELWEYAFSLKSDLQIIQVWVKFKPMDDLSENDKLRLDRAVQQFGYATRSKWANIYQRGYIISKET